MSTARELLDEACELLKAHVLDACAEDQDTCFEGADCTCAKVCQFLTRAAGSPEETSAAR